ncbi:hypothetical protein [Nocardia arthritidis]|uniref:Uncharacterized protein n=1 Tax=Nocardia arthritidis TaxID=228602 RepID=A0A6G9YBS4_9NOCA|nr:hypothetical protein [Nocardia arthritidis]QIS10618.1 hypothetical protein F5544_13650 [Nocardia arthritidis]
MSYVYQRRFGSESYNEETGDLEYDSWYSVGFYAPDGQWISESSHDDSERAAERVRWLNGGQVTEQQVTRQHQQMQQ